MAELPQVNFNWLGRLPAVAQEMRDAEEQAAQRRQLMSQRAQAFSQSQQDRAREQAFINSIADIPQEGGVVNYGELARRAARAGYMPGVEHFSKLAEAQAIRQEGKIPPGWRRNAQGGIEFIPKGPADPEYLAEAAGAKTKPRQFSISDITKLEEEGGKYSNLTRFATTFEPRFAGYKAPMAGSAAMAAGRYLPEGVVGKDVSEGAAWWADYQRSKNIIRNELFGSALTATEQSEFEKADVNPGMDPQQIAKNLKRQREIAANGIKKKANAMIASGYDPAVIAQAYGLDLKELGVTATGRRGGPAQTQGQSKQEPVYDRPEISEARTLIAQGRLTRAKAEEALRKNGIPFQPGDLDLD